MRSRRLYGRSSGAALVLALSQVALVAVAAPCSATVQRAAARGALEKGETYLPWTVATSRPVRFAPAIVLSIPSSDPREVQRRYEKWKAAGLWDWIDRRRKHKCVLYHESFRFRDFYADQDRRPEDPTDPNDPGYAFGKLDAIFRIPAIQRDGCRWMVKIDAAPWAGGPPAWMQRGDGVVNNEDNASGGAFPCVIVKGRGKPRRADPAEAARLRRTTRQRVIAWHRAYVQREMRYFSEALAKRYRGNKYLYALMVGELPTGRVLPPDFPMDNRPYFHQKADEWIIETAKLMPHTLILVAQAWSDKRRRMLATQPNIGFGCADCRCFAFGKKGPYYPDRPHVEATGYYAPAHEWNASAKNPPGKHRAVFFMSHQYNGWVLRRIQAGVAGKNNIYGLAEGTEAPKGRLRPEHYLAYLAGPPRNPGARPRLNNVPGVLPCHWIIIAERGEWAKERDPYKTIENWKAAFEDLGAQGIQAVPAEPYGWESEIDRRFRRR